MYKKNIVKIWMNLYLTFYFTEKYFLYLSGFLRIKVFNTYSQGTWCIPFSSRHLEYIMQYLKKK